MLEIQGTEFYSWLVHHFAVQTIFIMCWMENNEIKCSWNFVQSQVLISLMLKFYLNEKYKNKVIPNKLWVIKELDKPFYFHLAFSIASEMLDTSGCEAFSMHSLAFNVFLCYLPKLTIFIASTSHISIFTVLHVFVMYIYSHSFSYLKVILSYTMPILRLLFRLSILLYLKAHHDKSGEARKVCKPSTK